MKKYLLSAFVVLCLVSLRAQDLRNSLLQYQFNALPLNPAYAGKAGAEGFEAIYFGNFASEFQLSRSVLVSVHGQAGESKKAGVGGTLQFYQQDFFGEINLQPAYSRIFQLSEGQVAFGATLGVNYFDVDETVLTTVNSNFMSLDGGFGIYYHTDKHFAGISVLRLFEKSFFLDEKLPGNALQRENPFSLHAGTLFRINDQIKLKPAALLRYVNLYGLPDRKKDDVYRLLSADLHASLVIDDTYVAGLIFGYSDPELGQNISRVGLSATLLLGNFRLSYAIQHNSRADSAISLPVSHLFGAGYDFFQHESETPIRYF